MQPVPLLCAGGKLLVQSDFQTYIFNFKCLKHREENVFEIRDLSLFINRYLLIFPEKKCK